MPAPAGVWSINANCESGVLKLDFEQCNQLGSAFLGGNWATPDGASSVPITGFWNEEAQKLTFLKMDPGGDPETVQVFTGYLMVDPREPAGRACGLAGSFEAFRRPFVTQTMGICDRSVFGWFAQPQA